MKRNKIIAGLLLVCSLALTIGLALNSNLYWLIADIAVIVICLASGILLILKD